MTSQLRERLDDLEHKVTNLKEDQLEDAFKTKLLKLFEDV